MASPHWTAMGDHSLTLRMGPVEIWVMRWGADSENDDWYFLALIRGVSMIARGHDAVDRSRAVPLPQCQADAIAAVEAWRDSIVVDGKAASRG